MADAGGKKKGKKQKGKAVPLNAFLSSQTPPGGKSSVVYTSKSTSWADESEDLLAHGSPSWNDPYGQIQEVQRIVLPTAPRAARAGAFDLSQLPKGPPYTAFLGNLPYDVEEDDIYQFFHNVKVKDVRLPRETENGRLKGFGYAEFDDIDVFMRALTLDDETLKGRRIRVDIAGQSQGADREKDNRSRELPSESDGDWRTGSKDSAVSSGRQETRDVEERRDNRNEYGRDDNYGRDWRPSGDRSGGYGDVDGCGGRAGVHGSRGGGFGRSGCGDRDGYRNRKAGYGGRDGHDDRSDDSYGDRGFGGSRSYGNRGGFGDRRGYTDRGGLLGKHDGDSERGRGYGDRDIAFRDMDKGRGYEDKARGYGDRGSGYSYRSRGFGDGDRGYSDRHRGHSSRDRVYGDREREYGDPDRRYGDRDRGYGDRDRGYGDRDREYSDRDQGYGDGDRRYGDRDRGYGDRDRGYGDRDRGYGDRERGYSDLGYSDRGYGDQDGGFGDKDRSDRQDDHGVNRNESGSEASVSNGERLNEKEGQPRANSRGHGVKSEEGYRRGNRSEPRERPRLQLKPRSTPKDEDDANATVTSSAIFGGAKPVNTAVREMEIAARLEKAKAKKEPHDVSEGKPGEHRRLKSTDSDDANKKFEKSSFSLPSSTAKRQGERGDTVGGRGGSRGVRGQGRTKSCGRGGKKEPRNVEPKKYEEPEVKVWAEKSKYSALLETEDDEVDFRSGSEDEEDNNSEEEEHEIEANTGDEEESRNESGVTKET